MRMQAPKKLSLDALFCTSEYSGLQVRSLAQLKLTGEKKTTGYCYAYLDKPERFSLEKIWTWKGYPMKTSTPLYHQMDNGSSVNL